MKLLNLKKKILFSCFIFLENIMNFNEYVEGKVKGYQFKIAIFSKVFNRDSVQCVMEEIGLPVAYLSNPTKKRVVCRAAYETAKTNRRFKDHLARKIVENPSKMVIGIVDEERYVENESLAYQQGTTIRYDKESENVYVDGNMKKEFYDNYDVYSGGITGSDICETIYRIMRIEAKAIALIDRGHLYFVPYNYRNIIQKVEDFINRLNLGKICCCEIVDTDNSNKWIWDSAKHTVKMKVNNIMRGIDKINLRVNSLDKKASKLEKTAELLKSYALLTGFGVDLENALELIDNSTSAIASKISEIQNSVSVENL